MSDKQTRGIDIDEVHNETAIKEVQHLLKHGTINLNPEIINRLKAKYSNDNIVDSIMEYFTDRRTKIIKIASIFIEAFQRRYKDDFYTISLSKFMKRALKYKKKYELSDDEFDEIRRMFEMKIFNINGNIGAASVIYPNTNLSRVLGYPIIESTDPIKPSNSDDYAFLQDILNTYQAFRGIHSYIVIQTMLYQDLGIEALSGMFDQNKHDINCYVHPLLAALFLPKIVEIEERMLYANIAGIINTRYNKERIITKPDYELFYSMVVDPNDIVCNDASPMKDLKSRAEVQIQLWHSVYNLRNGKYYNTNSLDFISYIDKCKISNVDSPDILYLSDEGIILKRLFAIFAFRPIIVITQPIFGSITNNPFNLPVNHSTVTSIPYITYKLPNIQVAGQQYSLEDADKQVQFYMENGTYVPKVTNIIDCRGPLIFYIPRRSIQLPMEYSNPGIGQFSMSNLSVSTRHYNTINSIEIDFNYSMDLQINNTSIKYYLRSAVSLDKYMNNNMPIIIGHITYLYKYLRMEDNPNIGTSTDNIIINSIPTLVYVYNPKYAYTEKYNKKPIIYDTIEKNKQQLIKTGTIFIYAKN